MSADYLPKRGGKTSARARRTYEFIKVGDTVTTSLSARPVTYRVSGKWYDAAGVPTIEVEHVTEAGREVTEFPASAIAQVWAARS